MHSFFPPDINHSSNVADGAKGNNILPAWKRKVQPRNNVLL